jgi:L-threonylcarbamoyladenylate synthase
MKRRFDTDMDARDLDRTAAAIATGASVVYPTETVYGLGADALDPDAVERIFEIKGRDRSKPISMAVVNRDVAAVYTRFTDRERVFVERFLPGPVTVVVERTSAVPNVLTAGRDRVGLRIPDHDGARSLLERTGPLTATSANVSGTGSVRHPADLDPTIRAAVAVVIDDGPTPGGGSTVVDVEHGVIHRRGKRADEVERWLATH